MAATSNEDLGVHSEGLLWIMGINRIHLPESFRCISAFDCGNDDIPRIRRVHVGEEILYVSSLAAVVQVGLRRSIGDQSEPLANHQESCDFEQSKGFKTARLISWGQRLLLMIKNRVALSSQKGSRRLGRPAGIIQTCNCATTRWTPSEVRHFAMLEQARVQ